MNFRGNCLTWLARIMNGHLPMLALLLLAFALRVHQLEGQSMWSDEGLTLHRSSLSPTMILSNRLPVDGLDTRDTNPPLYFLLLHGWRELVGETIFAMRFLSVVAGTLSLPLVYILGQHTFDRRAGLVAALLLAVSPFHVWQSQEMRNYGLLLLLNLASVYGLFRFLLPGDGKRPYRWLLLWTVAGLAGIYTHYFGFFVFAFGLVALGVTIVWRPFSPAMRAQFWGWRRWLVAAGLLAGALLIPVVLVAWERFASGQQVDFVYTPPHHLLSHLVSVYGVGLVPGVVQPGWRVAPLVLLAGWGLAQVFGNKQKRTALWLTTAYQVIPLALLMALSLFNPLYNGPRHLLFGLPPFLLLAAVGVTAAKSRWGQGAAVLLLTAVLLNQFSWLDVQYNHPDLVKDDIREAARYLSTVAEPDDLIVLHDSLIAFTFAYYYDGVAPWRAIPAYPELDAVAAVQELQMATVEARRVWFLREPTPRTGFPRDHLPQWLAANWPLLESRTFSSLWLGVAVDGYAPNFVVADLPQTAVSLDYQWSNLRLSGLEMPPITSTIWQPTFYFVAGGAAGQTYSLSLHMSDSLGQTWLQRDFPMWLHFPPAQWPPEQIVRFQPLLPIPAGFPPGEYDVQLRLIVNDQPAATTTGQVQLSLTTAVAEAANLIASESGQTRTRFGRELTLVDFAIPAVVYRPGHLLPVELLWWARRQPTADYRAQVEVVAEDGRVVGTAVASLSRTDYPPTSWQRDQLVRGQVNLLITGLAEAGAHRVVLTLLPPEGERPSRWPWPRRTTTLAEIQVTSWPLTTELPPIVRPMKAEFGIEPLIYLHGYELTPDPATAGEPLALTLIWQSLSGTILTNYEIFVHLVDDAETIVAQVDGGPLAGFRPTSGWRLGEVLQDRRTLPISAELPPGLYDLWVGIYDPETFARLPIWVDDIEQVDGRLHLQQVEVR